MADANRRQPRIERVHAAAGLALLRFEDAASGAARTEWVPLDAPATATTAARQHASANAGAGRVDLDRQPSAFDASTRFVLAPPPPGAVQNLLVLLHGRGDSPEPFARLAAAMALPQTAAVALRAPLELPLGLGPTWLRDLDAASASFLPPDRPHADRSRSLDAARDHVQRFLSALRDVFGWSLARVFLLGYSQGAAVAFHAAMTSPEPLGGAVLVAGGALAGPHVAAYARAPSAAPPSAPTPVLLVAGAEDAEYPLALARASQRQFAVAFPRAPGAFECEVVPGKRHGMLASPREARAVMAFLAKRLHLSGPPQQPPPQQQQQQQQQQQARQQQEARD